MWLFYQSELKIYLIPLHSSTVMGSHSHFEEDAKDIHNNTIDNVSWEGDILEEAPP